MPAIAAIGLTKRYGPLRAVDDVTIRVAPGDIYALLGLNGAGKTTLIRMLLGMVRPTAGSVSLLGAAVDARRRRVWSRIGYLVEAPAAYPELTVRQNLDVVRRLRRLPDASCITDVIERLDLSGDADRPARALSLGNMQRLGLAKALMHRPEVLILDEPANGLDPAGVVEIRSLLRDLATEHGVTVFLSSHILSEVARLATRIGILHTGRLLREVTPHELADAQRARLSVASRDSTAAAAILTAAGYQVEVTREHTLTIGDRRAVEHPDEIASVLVRAGHPPTRLVVEREDLEQYFLRLVQSRTEGERG